MRTRTTLAAAAAVMLATASGDLAANEYHLMCQGANNTGNGTMTGSVSPNEYDTLSHNLCGHTVYLSPDVVDRVNQCAFEWNIPVRMYYHINYNNRLCTIGG